MNHQYVPYNTSDNDTPPISQVLIGRHLIFFLTDVPPCCNSPRKYTPVKYKKKQKTRNLKNKNTEQKNRLQDIRIKLWKFEAVKFSTGA